jgi:hypothetical protein
VEHDKKQWFRVRAAVTYDTEHFVQAATRDEALEAYWDTDISDTGALLDETVLEIEECENPVK